MVNNQKGVANIILVIVIVVIAGVAGYFVVRKSGLVAQQTPTPPLADDKNLKPTPKDETAGWITFKSSYFTLSFKVPVGFEVKEGQNYVLVAKSPYYTREIGDDNAFFRLNRYSQKDTRESKLTLYRSLLKNTKESTIMVGSSSFLTLTGYDWGRFEGESAGKVTLVFFDASWLEIIERPSNNDQDFDPIKIGSWILSTFKFSK